MAEYDPYWELAYYEILGRYKAAQERIHDLELAGEYANGGARTHGGRKVGDDSFKGCTNPACKEARDE